MEAVLNQKDDLYIAGKNKGKKSRALMRTLIITKSEDAQDMALFFHVCTVGCALPCTYTAEEIKYKD